MPTGYTAPIEEGCTFEEYAWGCARAFGALMEMRDAPNDAEVPAEFKPSNYHQEAIDKADADLRRLQNMSLAEIKLKINAEHARIERENAKRREEFKVKMQRYASIREKAAAWVPPTPEHEAYGRFMLDQIDLSTTRESAYQEPLPNYDAEQWWAEQIAKATRSLEYHKEEHAKEVERVKGRNEWVNALRKTIPQPTKKG